MSLSDYEIQDFIESGIQGSVYKTLNTKDNQYYAIKKIHKSYYASEGQLLKKLNHDSIITYYNTFQKNQYIYMITELGETDIYEYYSKRDNLSLDTIYNILQQVAEGIAYLHKHDIVHGDIKMENIIKCQNRYKLCDFGLSFQTKFMTYCPYAYHEIKLPEAIENIWGKPSDIWYFGKMISKLLLCYRYPKRYYLKTLDYMYMYLLELRNLCLEKNYHTRITITEIIEYLEDIS